MVVIGSEENIANRRRLYSCLFIFYVSHFQYTDVYKCISQNMHGYLLAFYGYSLVFLQISGMPRICQVDDAFGVAVVSADTSASCQPNHIAAKQIFH